MRKVFLHGELGESLGKEWDLEVDSVQEVFCAIEANTNRFTRFLAENSEKFKYYTFQIDNEYLTSKKELECKLPKEAKNIHIMPQIAGGDPVSILIQVVIAVATSLIMQALFKPPKAKEQKETKSYLFAGTQNVAAQGIPVPLGYGRLKVGSVVVSAAVRHVAYKSSPGGGRPGGMFVGGMGGGPQVFGGFSWWNTQGYFGFNDPDPGNTAWTIGSVGAAIGPMGTPSFFHYDPLRVDQGGLGNDALNLFPLAGGGVQGEGFNVWNTADGFAGAVGIDLGFPDVGFNTIPTDQLGDITTVVIGGNTNITWVWNTQNENWVRSFSTSE